MNVNVILAFTEMGQVAPHVILNAILVHLIAIRIAYPVQQTVLLQDLVLLNEFVTMDGTGIHQQAFVRLVIRYALPVQLVVIQTVRAADLLAIWRVPAHLNAFALMDSTLMILPCHVLGVMESEPPVTALAIRIVFPVILDIT